MKRALFLVIISLFLIISGCTNLVNGTPEVSDPSPADGAKGQPLDLILSWKVEDRENDPVTFDVYLNGNLMAENLDKPFHRLKDLNPLKKYTWKVVVRDRFGNTLEGPDWSFETGPRILKTGLTEGWTVGKVRIFQKSGGGYYVVAVGYYNNGVRQKDPVIWTGAPYFITGDYVDERLLAVSTVGDGYVFGGCKAGRPWVEVYSSYLTERWSSVLSGDGCVLAVGSDSDYVYAAGYVYVNGKKKMAVWKLSLGDGTVKRSEVYHEGVLRALLVDGVDLIVAGESDRAFIGWISTDDLELYRDISGLFGTGSFEDIIKDGSKYLVVGSVKGNAYVYAMYMDGEKIFETSFGGSSDDGFRGIVSVEDGYVAFGYTESEDGDVGVDNKGGKDGWLVKMNKKGEIKWGFVYGTEEDEEFLGVIPAGADYLLFGSKGGEFWGGLTISTE